MVSTMSFFAATRSNRAKPGALTHKLPRLARVRVTSAPWTARPWLRLRRSESPSTHDFTRLDDHGDHRQHYKRGNRDGRVKR